jgi:hypothetical protein
LNTISSKNTIGYIAEVILDVAGGHAFGVHGHDPRFDVASAGLPLFGGLQLKGSVSVAWDSDFALAPFAFYSLFAVATAAVAAVISQNTVLFITQMLVHFSFKHFF